MDRFVAFAIVLGVATFAAYFRDLVRIARRWIGRADRPERAGASDRATPVSHARPLLRTVAGGDGRDGDAWPRLLELAFRDMASPDERRYERARLIVASWPGPEVIDEAIALLRESSSILRARACDLLYRIGDERALEPVYEYLSHETPESVSTQTSDDAVSESHDPTATGIRAALGERAPSAMLRKAA